MSVLAHTLQRALRRTHEEAEYLMWKYTLLAVGFLVCGCVAVESAAGYLGELYGFYRCRQECARTGECSCTPPSERQQK